MPYICPATIKVIKYIKEKYDADPEFMWARTPGNSIFRHRDNQKWYGVLLTVSRAALKIQGQGNVEILNLKLDPILIGSLIDNKSFFPAYHMNKEHWISLLMDGSIKDKDMFALIDISFNTTTKKIK
ncbi:MAG: MmcQ/YjbR family DNA-binding protein [Rickettsiales bacterium]|jgi:predicted DNA-binding protein (MmcQ/YjbR family)|nr:MmcQ/YjbR family DNA-binding protein [Rickettsiales bacterium]